MLAIAEEPSLTEAAARRHVTQPAFSRRIRAIEAYLGTTLIDRSRRPARPSKSLLELTNRFRDLATHLRRLSHDLAADRRLDRPTVVIACQHALAVSVAPALAKRVHTLLDDATVRLNFGNRDECLWQLMTRKASLLVAYETDSQQLVEDPGLVEKRVFAGERVIPVVAPRSPAARWEPRSGDRLPVVAYPANVFFGQAMVECILPRLTRMARYVRVAETALTLAARQLALAGLGVAWVPESLVHQDLKDRSLTALSSDFGECPMSLAAMRLRTSNSKESNAVWGAFDEQFGREMGLRSEGDAGQSSRLSPAAGETAPRVP